MSMYEDIRDTISAVISVKSRMISIADDFTQLKQENAGLQREVQNLRERMIRLETALQLQPTSVEAINPQRALPSPDV